MEASQLLFYVLLIAGIVGFNLLMRHMNSKAKGWQEKLEQRQRGDAIGTASSDVSVEAAAARSPWGGAAREQAAVEPMEVVLARRARLAAQDGLDKPDQQTRAAPARPATTQKRRTQPMFSSEAELRQAIVLMTVLGPCRATAPYGRDDSGQHARPFAGRLAIPGGPVQARFGVPQRASIQPPDDPA